MPKDNLERAIKRGAGQLEGVDYEEVSYEGYGPQGAALIIDCLTDNKVRTVAEVRHALTKHGGNLGTEGSVAYLFHHCGQLIFAPGAPEDRIYETAIEAGAEDVLTLEDGSIEIIVAVPDFMTVRDALKQKGLVPEGAELVWRPQTLMELAPEDEEKLQKLLDALDNTDDVQEVYTNVAFKAEA
jgi:YebC/PmpR family DNA-binding regulatory protein